MASNHLDSKHNSEMDLQMRKRVVFKQKKPGRLFYSCFWSHDSEIFLISFKSLKLGWKKSWKNVTEPQTRNRFHRIIKSDGVTGADFVMLQPMAAMSIITDGQSLGLT